MVEQDLEQVALHVHAVSVRSGGGLTQAKAECLQ